MVTSEYWDLLINNAYLGADNLVTEEPSLPNWPFEEYVYVRGQLDSQWCKDDPATTTSAADREADRVTACSGPATSPFESGKTFDTAAGDIDGYMGTIGDDDSGIEQSTGDNGGVMLPLNASCAQKEYKSVEQPENTRKFVPTASIIILAAGIDHKGMPQCSENDAITSRDEIQATQLATVEVNKQQTDKRISITGLGDFSVLDRAGNHQGQRYSPSQKEEESKPVLGVTRRLQLHSKAPSYLEVATEGYHSIFLGEESRQQKILTCYIHAHPASVHKSKTLCVQEADQLRRELLSRRERRLRAACPAIPFKPPESFPDFRLMLQQTLGLIIAAQNTPRVPLNPKQKEVYDACIILETLRWEVELMCEVTRRCDSDRLERIQETGIKYRIRDGVYIDLMAMLSFSLNSPEHSGQQAG